MRLKVGVISFKTILHPLEVKVGARLTTERSARISENEVRGNNLLKSHSEIVVISCLLT